MQKRKRDTGSVMRVPAPEIEALVIKAIRAQLKSEDNGDCQFAINDRELIERHVQCITIKPDAIEIRLVDPTNTTGQADNCDDSATHQQYNNPQSITVTLPWAAPSFIATKGILHAPSSRPMMKPEMRDALLTAIANARSWIDDLIEGRAESFAAIVKRESESKVERHVRFLAPLAFLSPRITAAIIDRSAPHDLRVTSLVKALPYSWAEQERRIGIACS